MIKNKCKICRRVGEKLFLKGDKCLSPKCPMIKRPYAPGQRAKKRKSGLTEYGKELREKQKIKNWYGLSESQFKRYANETMKEGAKLTDVSSALVQKLESRIDNVILKLGWARSRSEARQLVTHGHFLVNGRRTDIPSFRLKIGDVVSIREGSKKSFKNIEDILKKAKVPEWIGVDVKKIEAKIVKYPKIEDVQLPGELSTVFEHYSR